MKKYKEGDIIVCLPGFDTSDRTPGVSGGAGWKEGKMYKLRRMEGEEIDGCGIIVWPDTGGCGIYSQACRPATSEEIEWYKKGNRNIEEMPKILAYEIY